MRRDLNVVGPDSVASGARVLPSFAVPSGARLRSGLPTDACTGFVLAAVVMGVVSVFAHVGCRVTSQGPNPKY